MTGLDKMVNQILDEAKNSANAKIEEANSQAEALKAEALEEVKVLVAEISKQSDADIANYKERVKSAADLKRRTAILTAKQEMISQVIDKAYAKFCAKDGDAYFKTLKEMLKKFAQPLEGEIYFSSEDLKRLPAGFADEAAKIAKSKGGKLTVAKEAKNIEKVFVLAYGGIEENCSFKAMFDAKRDELQDQVQKILFS